MNFKKTVQSMTIDEIIMSMVNGLKAQHYKINMFSFGMSINNICYGCAATNCITEISKNTFTPDSINYITSRAKFLKIKKTFLTSFERAINALRIGNFSHFNMYADSIRIDTIPQEYIEEFVPPLGNLTYKDNLKYYEEFAERLKKFKS